MAIRIGIADLAANPDEVRLLLGIDPCINQGLDLTAPGAGTQVYDRTLYDDFQAKIGELQRLKGEEGVAPIFRNNIPDLPDIHAYLQTANIRFTHGYPREAADLPCISITLGSEAEGQKYLGVQKSQLLGSDDQGNIAVMIGSDMAAEYHIMVLTPNYDETVVLFHLIKYALLKYRDHLEGYGIREAQMQWQPCEPAPDFLQGGIFAYQRTCILSCVKDESFIYKRPAFTQLAYSVQAGGDTIVGPRDIIPPGPDEGDDP